MRKKELEALRRQAAREPPMAQVALDDLANPESVRGRLREEFERSLRANGSTEQLIKRLRDVCEMSRNRARTIAVTERTRAANGQRFADAIEEYLQEHEKAVRWHKKRPAKPVFQWVNPRYA
jgi:hypothetical protein